MSKKQKISFIRERIMIDIEQIECLLMLISTYKVETLKEAVILANIALGKSKRVNKNNELLGKILGC